jgi:uncharacterized protein (TIGR01777 family)
MKVLISGGSGLIGSALTKYLIEKGDSVIILTRYPEKQAISEHLEYHFWDGKSPGEWQSAIEIADAVINLAGENIGAGRWTENQKKKIIESRTNAGKVISNAIRLANKKPEVLIQASGIGIYGTSQNEKFDEYSPLGNDYLSDVGKKWEESSRGIEDIGVRRVILRTGVVLDLNRGAFPKMYLPFRLFVGGKIGSGNQWISWIHLEDEIRIIYQAIHEQDLNGPINATSPNPVTNAEFGKTISMVANRPYWIPVPAFGLRLILGEMSTLVLDGQHVISRKLFDYGFKFNFPSLPAALTSIL